MAVRHLILGVFYLLGTACSQLVADRVQQGLDDLEVVVHSVTMVVQPLRPPFLDLRISIRCPIARQVRVTELEYEVWFGEVSVMKGRLPEDQLHSLTAGTGDAEIVLRLPLTPGLLVRLASQGPGMERDALRLNGWLQYISPFGSGEATFEIDRILIAPTGRTG
ncbi:MAG: hypothetical protein ABIK09_10075 [Pseudomonadota bacterium]